MQTLPCRPRLVRATREGLYHVLSGLRMSWQCGFGGVVIRPFASAGVGVADKCGRGMNPQHRRRHFHPQTGKDTMLE